MENIGLEIQTINIGNPNRIVKIARKKQFKYMFNSYTGEIAVSNDSIVSDFKSPWYYIHDTIYPVYDGIEYIGSMWDGLYEKVNVRLIL